MVELFQCKIGSVVRVIRPLSSTMEKMMAVSSVGSRYSYFSLCRISLFLHFTSESTINRVNTFTTIWKLYLPKAIISSLSFQCSKCLKVIYVALHNETQRMEEDRRMKFLTHLGKRESKIKEKFVLIRLEMASSWSLQ